MTAIVLSIHVLAAIVFIGPVTAVASLFPRYARAALADRSGSASEVVRLLYRISSGYAVGGLAVPVFGISTALQIDVLTQTWLLVSVALTAAAAVLLAAVILPRQRRMLTVLNRQQLADAFDHEPQLRRLGMLTGLFALSWAVVVVLMIVRPGSTTGVMS